MEGVRPHESSYTLGFSQSLKEWEGTDLEKREVSLHLK